MAAAAGSDAYLEGYRAYVDADFDRAVDGFKRAIVENPENFMAYWWLANVYIEKRLYGKAKGIVSIADRVKIAPPELPPEVFDDRRRLVGSEREYRERKAAGEKLHREGRAAVAAGKWEEAAAKFRAACGENPLEPRHFESLADALADRGEPEEACDAYLKARLLAPRDARILRKLADAEERLGRTADCLESLKALHALAPDAGTRDRIQALAEKRLTPSARRVLKRRGDSVWVDLGYGAGLDFGDEFKTKLRVVRTDRDRAVNDISTGAPIGYEEPVPVGDIMVVKIDDDWCEARVVGEWNGGIRVGDELLWQQTKRSE
jgi:tetratricopeptide (TPR) repeat protein